MFEFGNRVAVKICGLTNLDDALASAVAGADILGLNFSPLSSRCLSADCAAEIVRTVRAEFPQTKFAGVFVNQENAFVQALADDLTLDAVQFHGEETPEVLDNLRAPFVIKALPVGPQFTPESAVEYDCDAILLDGWSDRARGGTGETFPWATAAKVLPLVRRLILAGGLDSNNVAQALQVVRPFAVDVCSGVEDRPGRKNHREIHRFIEAVRTASAVNV